MKREKTGMVVGILILVIVLLLLVLVYVFAIRPAITGYTVRAQNEGVQFTILSIMQQAATCQTVPLTFGNETMNMIWVECLRQEE